MMNEELIKILEAAKLVLWDGKDHVFLYDQTKLKYACWAISSVVTDGVDTYGRCVPLALQNLVNDHIGANETMLTYLYDVKCGYIKATNCPKKTSNPIASS